MRICSYSRVSTQRQGESGLGLAAQKTDIETYAAANKAEIIAEFIEVESGGKNDRPELLKAIKHARLTGSRLVISRLDRLSRNAAFLLTLKESGVDFVCCDMPNANTMTIGVMALVAQESREAISKNTKAALAACRLRGIKLGNPNGAAALRRAQKGNTDAVRAIRAKADYFAAELFETVEDIQSKGFMTLKAQATELNKRGIKTARGGRWHASSVSNLHKRLEAVA